MINVDLNFELKDLAGKASGNAAETIAGLLMTETKGDAVKMFNWAIALGKKETITVDSSDLTKLKGLIEASERLIVMAKGPILEYLNTLK